MVGVKGKGGEVSRGVRERGRRGMAEEQKRGEWEDGVEKSRMGEV